MTVRIVRGMMDCHFEVASSPVVVAGLSRTEVVPVPKQSRAGIERWTSQVGSQLMVIVDCGSKIEKLLSK